MSEFDRHLGTYPLPRKPCKFLTIKCLPFHHHISMWTSNRISLPAHQFPRIYSSSFAPTLFRCWVHLQNFFTYPLPRKPSRCLAIKCLQYHRHDSIWTEHRVSVANSSLPRIYVFIVVCSNIVLLGTPPSFLLTL